jgi:hypothetical protein
LIKETPSNFTWTPFSDEICPSSIAKHFSDCGHNVKLWKNKNMEKPEYGLKFPSITDEFSFPGISEYVGMILLGCNVDETDFSSYRIPTDHVDVGKGKVLHCKGFIAPETILKLLKESRKILAANPDFPWIALSFIVSNKPPRLLLLTHDEILSL